MIDLEFLEKNRKASDVICDFYTEKLLLNINEQDFPDNFKEFIKSQRLTDDKLLTFVNVSPRGLFDVFDSFKIYINIDARIENDSVMYSYTLLPRDIHCNEKEWYSSRLDVERVAIKDAFIILNEKLCEQTQ
jgi:hypothetical protein